MSNFTVRIVLHDVSYDESEEYTELHDAMFAAGFSRIIDNGKGVKYHMPPAEYNYSHATQTVSEVSEKARKTAESSYEKKKVSVLVTQGNRAWSNLERMN